ncbi:MAG TPA: hypothetical protein DCZ63_08470 [Geobacter sp.]|nr:hypothetical protein [Geobacter sp.]
MVRPASYEDIPRLVCLGKEFLGATMLAPVIGYNPESIRRLLMAYLEDEECAVFVLMKDDLLVGVIGGAIVPAYWNEQARICQQFFYYVDPAHRSFGAVALFNTFEKWGIERRAECIFSGAKLGERFEGMHRLLTRKQYEPLEVVYMKEVK